MEKKSNLGTQEISFGYTKYILTIKLVMLLSLVTNMMPVLASMYTQYTNFSSDFRTTTVNEILKQTNLLSYSGDYLVVTTSEEALLKQKITGIITDADTKETLVGVTVLIKGTTQGTVTDVNGKFSLEVPDQNAVLVISYIGFEKQEVNVGANTVLNISLRSISTKLNEIIVVGYGTQTKATLTGSISTVSNAELASSASANPLQRMQGKVTGVNILNSHTPGGDANITIHGMGTINNNDPLYIIDGVPTKWGMTQINPDEIESMTVLKDASSAAIYGARGANGVIIITTKHGKAGKPRITFSARNGIGNATNKYDLLNTKEYGELLWLEAKNEGRAPNSLLYGTGATPVIPDYTSPAGAKEGDPSVDPLKYSYDPTNLYLIAKTNKIGTDWYNVIYRTARIQDYNMSVSGGSEKGTYAFTTGYYDEQGILRYTGFNRLSIRLNSEAEVSKWLKVGESLGLGYTNGFGNRLDNGEGTPISEAYRMQPIVPVYDIMGNFAGTKGNGTGNGENPLAMLFRDQNDYGRDLRGIGNAFAELTLLKKMHFKTLYGFDYRSYNGRDIFIKNPEFQEAKPTDQLTMSNNYTIQWNWVNTLDYSKTIAGDHNLKLLAGVEAISRTYNNFGAARSTFFSTDVNYMYLSAGEKDQTNYGDGYIAKTASYFGRLNYDYKGKYLAEVTFRRDGSSVFGANSRYGNFPAFSLGWRISEENFMSGTKSWMDYLKIKGGFGISGNDEMGGGGVYNGFTTYSSNNQFSFYGLTGNPTGSTAGFSHYLYGNPDAKWETTKTLNIGFDGTFFNNALTASVDVWNRKTLDMLYRMQVANVIGTYVLPSVNIGDMANNGIDITLGYHNKAMGGDFKYDLTLTFSHYKNKIVKLTNNQADFIDGANLRQMLYSRAMVGTSYPEFFGLIVDGIFQTQEEADAYYKEYGGQYNLAGHFKFRDVNKDGKIDDNDRTFIGSPHPKFTGGLNIDLSYKNVNLSAFLYSSYGNKVMNYVKRWIDYAQFNGNRSKARLYSSWGSPYLTNNADATLPLADLNTISQYPSTAFLEDGSFLRLKSLQIGYDLPSSLNKTLGMEKMEVYIQTTNLFTITKYKGLDPEISASGVNLGIDQGSWPTTRQFMIGLKVDF